MKYIGVKKLAFVLKIMVLVVFVCNLLALFMVPGLVGLRMDWQELFKMGSDPHEPLSPILFLVIMWPEVFRHIFQVWKNEYVVLTLFLLLCGACTAVILWQAKQVLDTILKEEPFTMKNARSLKTAAVCCFVISGAALVRLIWGFVFYQSISPLLTYNAFFVPIFLMGGLLFLVMSALFRQATELKEENDLTI